MESNLTVRVVSAIETGKGITISDYRKLDLGKVRVHAKEQKNINDTKEEDGLIV